MQQDIDIRKYVNEKIEILRDFKILGYDIVFDERVKNDFLTFCKKLEKENKNYICSLDNKLHNILKDEKNIKILIIEIEREITK